ncbi:hypothetical protein C2G38_143667 [Gigaspora rosea]|uniref:Uncharacterized protein n=1 Tax=Gigaspora rosea TaxID=44941 RepID=A0A397VY51_9GLOM|nr:hypothetical protein C2G38_143667 [Gigaspora rosea]
MSDTFIKNFTNYIQSEGNIYRITQMPTKQFAMVIPDEFGPIRDSSNGRCRHCKHYNTSPAWCQSCDPWKTTQILTSGNKEIDKFIKEFQTKATEYEKAIEWIPFDRLDNWQEIKNESDQVFMANWSDGIRTIEGELGNYTQSRTILCVELMKSHCLQNDALDLIENAIREI